jgi:hypothetical protein
MLTFCSNSYCYIDPGTGSFIFQLFAAGILSSLFGIKTYWQSFKNLFSRKK